MRTKLVCVLAFTLAVACTDAAPCTNCPDLSGTYTMQWSRHSTDCATQGPQPREITITQFKSNLFSSVADASIEGTLYDTADFVMTGSRLPNRYIFRGFAVTGKHLDAGTRLPDGGLSDAGPRTEMTINGSLTTSDIDSDAGCNGQDDFVGHRLE